VVNDVVASIRGRLRRIFKSMLRWVFEHGQRLGIDILPRHYYSEIPDVAQLRTDPTWRRPFSLVGIQGIDIADQLEVLAQWCPAAIVERADVYPEACRQNREVGYGPIEAQVLYCYIHAVRPRRVIQVGCGVSTAVMLRASRDAGYEPCLTCIEPYPSDYLRERSSAGEVELIEERAESVDLRRFDELSDGDLLFIDSTHTVKPGSEVNRLVLDVLPTLPRGCFVHFHDIYWPHGYSPGLLSEDLFFWNESALVQALLVNNSRVTVRVCMSVLHDRAPAEVQRILPAYRPAADVDGLLPGQWQKQDVHFPSAAYFEVVGDSSG
jgi:predicted O-methyltransferase YrrM